METAGLLWDDSCDVGRICITRFRYGLSFDARGRCDGGFLDRGWAAAPSAQQRAMYAVSLFSSGLTSWRWLEKFLNISRRLTLWYSDAVYVAYSVVIDSVMLIITCLGQSVDACMGVSFASLRRTGT